MRYTIDEAILEKHNLTIEEFLVLLLSMRQVPFDKVKESLIKKKIADTDLFDEGLLVLSNNTKDLVTAVLIDSDKHVVDKDSEYEALAVKMKEIFPAGRKAGTTYLWRDSTAVIARKLKTVTVQFGCKFTEEEALRATKNYVESFNGDYRFMQLLKYFILKKDTSTGEIRSDFMALLESGGEVDTKQDWTSTLN